MPSPAVPLVSWARQAAWIAALPSVEHLTVTARLVSPQEPQKPTFLPSNESPSPTVLKAEPSASPTDVTPILTSDLSLCNGSASEARKMPPAVGASSLSRPVNTTLPSDALGGAVEPNLAALPAPSRTGLPLLSRIASPLEAIL